MKKIIVATLAWISGILGQTAIAKEGRENIKVQTDSGHERLLANERSTREVTRDKSALDALDKAGVLRQGDNEKDGDCGNSCWKPEK